ncbi:MAG: isoprenyl transferase [Bacillota bacterium]
MDGNGRWARQRGLPRLAGHRAGAEAVKRTVEAAGKAGIRYLTLFAFSTENWRRPAREVKGLMKLLVDYAANELETLRSNNIRLRVIGDTRPLPEEVQQAVEKCEAATEGNTGLTVILALNYGGRWDIVRACRKLCEKVARVEIKPEDVDEELLSKELATVGVPDPDLVIRTSGEKRISNFLLWQCAYSELWYTDVLWPDFGRSEIEQALRDFGRRHRRYGGLGKTRGRNNS